VPIVWFQRSICVGQTMNARRPFASFGPSDERHAIVPGAHRDPCATSRSFPPVSGDVSSSFDPPTIVAARSRPAAGQVPPLSIERYRATPYIAL
jgi:hypothetical protein